jgi:predicted transcriptional regulator
MSNRGEIMSALISANVPAGLYERLCDAARRDDRSMSSVVRLALSQYLEREEALRELLEVSE